MGNHKGGRVAALSSPRAMQHSGYGPGYLNARASQSQPRLASGL